ncbi:hypothetical protein I79_022107 [Cricetulus griseus]|uniref:Uncharacterized protein n=1 Tax=Cricetulus griseus TaxID=10029 RepID=G3IEG0_CRIGR|nr:hypothetical protein I79_022107 [Cricetulus griseus]
MKLNLGLLQKTTDWLLAKNTILGAFNMLELDNLKVLSSQNVYGTQASGESGRCYAPQPPSSTPAHFGFKPPCPDKGGPA